MVCVPTTLSAGDFSSGAGVTDVAKGHKQAIYHIGMMARAVVLDPSHEQADGSDALWGFVGTDIPWDQYKAEFA